jgi:hypothetical protein
LTNNTFCQTVANSDTLNSSQADQSAEIVGGKDSLLKFIYANFKYERKGLCGYPNSVRVEYLINESGEFSNLTAITPTISEIRIEMIRVLKLMPNWRPATKNGKAIKSKQSISFILK